MPTSNSTITTDFLIIGGGIIGLTIALELASKYQNAKIVILEKEKKLGEHASGRNSGVIHSGFYYTADTLKARFTRKGNAALAGFCRERNIRVNACGKLVVAKDANDLPGLDVLLERAQKNGVSLERITREQAKSIEPRVKTVGHALFSPTTASVDPLDVVTAMADEARARKIEIHLGTTYMGRKNSRILTNTSEYEARYFINAAGLHADSIARDFGFSENYYLLPFKGLYLYAAPTAPSLSTNIYPVPNLENPFLGVHFTVTSAGKVKIGPTAIPCLWREQYSWKERFHADEFFDILCKQIGLCTSANFNFRKLAFEEIRKQFRFYIVKLASELVEGVRLEDFRTWGKPGIRAQLVDKRTRKLEMDFVIENDDRSLHVLNAVSPAFTCSIPFAEYVVEKVQESFR